MITEIRDGFDHKIHRKSGRLVVAEIKYGIDHMDHKHRHITKSRISVTRGILITVTSFSLVFTRL